MYCLRRVRQESYSDPGYEEALLWAYISVIAMRWEFLIEGQNAQLFMNLFALSQIIININCNLKINSFDWESL